MKRLEALSIDDSINVQICHVHDTKNLIVYEKGREKRSNVLWFNIMKFIGVKFTENMPSNNKKLDVDVGISRYR